MNLSTLTLINMRHFVRQPIRGGKVGAFTQYYESKISDKIFKTISSEIDVKGTNMKLMKSMLNIFKI